MDVLFIFISIFAVLALLNSHNPFSQTAIAVNAIRGENIDLGDYVNYQVLIDKNSTLSVFGMNFNKKLIHKFAISEIDELDIKIEVEPDEFTEKDKTVLGRAVLGGIILGPVGAIVGGMSGIGTKKNINKGKKDFYLYIRANNTQEMLFKIVCPTDISVSNFIGLYRQLERLSSATESVLSVD